MRTGLIKAPQDAVAGLALIALAAFALWLGAGLDIGSLRQIGPGMVPRAVAVLVAVCGLVVLVNACREPGAGLDRWSLRGPVFILGGAVAFALAVRPLGLAVAGPIAVVIGSFASRETRLVESLIFGAVMTAVCIGLFKYLLSLPIPVAPWLINY